MAIYIKQSTIIMKLNFVWWSIYLCYVCIPLSTCISMIYKLVLYDYCILVALYEHKFPFICKINKRGYLIIISQSKL